MESGRSEGNLCSSLFNAVFCNRKRTKRRNWQKPRMQGMGGRSFGSPPTPSPHHYMFLLATKLSFQPLTKLEWDCLDRIGLQIGLDWTDNSP